MNVNKDIIIQMINSENAEATKLKLQLEPLQFKLIETQERIKALQTVLSTFRDDDILIACKAESNEINTNDKDGYTPSAIFKNDAYNFIKERGAQTKKEIWDYLQSKNYRIKGERPISNLAAHLSLDNRFYFDKEVGKWELSENKLI